METPRVHSHRRSRRRRSLSRSSVRRLENNMPPDIEEAGEIILVNGHDNGHTNNDDADVLSNVIEITNENPLPIIQQQQHETANNLNNERTQIVPIAAARNQQAPHNSVGSGQSAAVVAGTSITATHSTGSGSLATDEQRIHRGIMSYVDREMKTQKKTQSLSDPTASPAQRSNRSRSSLEKSPRRKRSKSESRRRRERKLIAAGEMEVRQANETLMRYLKQCTEINDASLSGELEIDKNFDDRRVHRKTKSQRDRKGLQQRSIHGKIHGTSGLQSILNDLTDDIVPTSGEIYNPFTPVISPTDGPPTHIDKMFIQTSNGYRSVDNHFYKTQMTQDVKSNDRGINNAVYLSCTTQRLWILLSNICHGLLGGLALAHLLFIITTKPYDWTMESINHYSAFAEIYASIFYCLAIVCVVSIFDRMDICRTTLFNTVDSIPFRSIIIVMIYLSTIILSLSSESMNGRLHLTNFNHTGWEEKLETNQILSVWNSLSIARSIGALFGWILIGMHPTDDLLFEHLLELENHQYQSNNN